MEPTPLQSLLGLAALTPKVRLLVELVLTLAAGVPAATMRGFSKSRGMKPVNGTRSRWVRRDSLAMCAIGLALDAVSSPASLRSMPWWPLTAALALVFTSWGVIKLLLDAAEASAHRRHAHFSTIFKDLLMIALYAVVVMVVLRLNFRVDPARLLASTAVVAVVVGLALQELLGNVFNGLTLQIDKPLAPGDWVRFGPHVGRVQGIGWRSTVLVTRANEKLEIPNVSIAKELLTNYSGGLVAEHLSLGLSYAVAPNYARQVIAETLRDVAGVLQNPAPQIYAWEFGDFSIQYQIRYWIADYADIERIRDAVNTGLWYALRRKSIEIPFPIRTLRMPPEAALPERDSLERDLLRELHQINFLRNLSDDELRLLMAGVTIEQFGAAETIVRQGDLGDSLYLIRSGVVEIFAIGRDGKQVHIRDLTRPAFFGEMALMTGEPRTATVRARTDAELLKLNRDGFVELFKTHPEAVSQIGETIALRMTETRELLAAAPQGDDTRNRTTWLLNKMRSVFNLAALR